MSNKNEAQIKFCVRYLLQNGVDTWNFSEVAASLQPTDPIFVLVLQEDSFFVETVTKMRELWPQGEKDGKWTWRGPVNKLAERMEFIWKNRKVEKEYTTEDCLEAARRYLAQFENRSVKYMCTLPYFIFKQEKFINPDGHYDVKYKSPLLDFLEGNAKEEEVWSNLEGELI